MNKYNPQQFEPKWQKNWEESGLFRASDDEKLPKFYCLDMFPYPSGEGLHLGHWRSYLISDIVAKYQKLNGKNVLHPMGYDAFGLPAENAAIKANIHPREYTNKSIKNFKRQLSQMGASFDWTREISTADPEYYRWTQWIFLKLYKNGLAYRKNAPVNWCPSCQTVLANEQVVSGECERCGSKVTKKDLTQWFFKITEYAEDLLNDLDELDWPERVKTLQRNWIGKSSGAMVKFEIKNNSQTITVFTTRIDTLCGATFMVLAPEHPLIDKIATSENKGKIDEYIEKSKKESDIEREATDKEKTGVFTGAYAINPITKKEMPIWVSDYVLISYGTGAVMCVPAHDNRDFEFAKKFDIPITYVIEPKFVATDCEEAVKPELEFIKRDNICAVVKNPKNNKYLCVSWNNFKMNGLITGGIESGEDIVETAKREILEESGYKNLKYIRTAPLAINTFFYHRVKKQNRWAHFQFIFFDLIDEDQQEIANEDKELHGIVWKSEEELKNFFTVYEGWYLVDLIKKGDTVYADTGILNNSGKYDGLDSEVAKDKIIEDLKKENIAEHATNYRLRDWLISRQRYWGAPIPIVYCDKCGEIAVPEKDLPVKLPDDVEFKPHGDSPLKSSKEFLNVKCPSCGGVATRETDTMDTFVCSSWYHLRFTDPKNSEIFADPDKINYWLPVDFYVGGIEHAILHLLYARFISKALHNMKVINFSKNGEPFSKLFNIGMVNLHGSKMSKSKGNVVSPDGLIEKYGSDSLRGYVMFLGPADQDSEWQMQGITGIYRFLEKIWNFYQKEFTFNDKKDPVIEKSIKLITMEIEEIRPNTAISHLMELFNYLKDVKEIPKEYLNNILILLSPFFPHIAEELWQQIGEKDSIFNQKWPLFDEDLVTSQKVKVAIQVNGKVRSIIEIETGIDQQQVEKLAKESLLENKALQGATIEKVIYVPGRILNFVIK